MLSPKRVKHRKQQTGRMKGKAYRGSDLYLGDVGIQAKECGYISSRQIEAARVAMTRYVKRGGDIWVRIFPDKPLTKKPLEVRQGKGKGSVEEWVAVVKPGRILFEMGGLPRDVANEALRRAVHKLPIPCKIISKESESMATKKATA